MFKLYDTFHGTPVLVGTYDTISDARRAARKLNENTRGRFRPVIKTGDKIVSNWAY